MDKNLLRFVAVDFVDDENVSGYTYWYVCEFDNIAEGDTVVAPLGRHNNLQKGIVRKIQYSDELNAPFPVHSVKYIKQVLKGTEARNV